jgi:hypothetical protein
MANNKNTKQNRGRGRPKLTEEQKAKREKMTKVAFMLEPAELALLDNFIEMQKFAEGKRFTRASAGRHLVISRLRYK